MDSVYSNLEEVVSSLSFNTVIIASVILTLLALVALFLKNQSGLVKKLLFISMTLVTSVATLTLAGSTIYLNHVSSSKGPVHYHADFEVWSCGEEIELIDPVGLSNKIGTATLHEHNDKRIHLEGVVVTPQDASLGKFFKVIGGELTNKMLLFPTPDGTKRLISGGTCAGKKAELQVFAYKSKDGIYSQQKLSDPNGYVIAPASAVPLGDCIIVEFDEAKDKTDKLCRSYKVAESIGKLKKDEATNGN